MTNESEWDEIMAEEDEMEHGESCNCELCSQVGSVRCRLCNNIIGSKLDFCRGGIF